MTRPTFHDFKKKALRDPGVRAEYESLSAAYHLRKKLIGLRKKAGLTQEELAVRAGLSTGTVKNIENKGQSSIESVVRLGLALGLADHFQELFKLQVKSIAQMDQAEQSKRIRASRRVIK